MFKLVTAAALCAAILTPDLSAKAALTDPRRFDLNDQACVAADDPATKTTQVRCNDMLDRGFGIDPDG